jgi:hypothetical protein
MSEVPLYLNYRMLDTCLAQQPSTNNCTLSTERSTLVSSIPYRGTLPIKKRTPPLGPPEDPRHMPTVGS